MNGNEEELCKYCLKNGLFNKIQLFQINCEVAMKLCIDPKCISAFIEEDPACLIVPHNLVLIESDLLTDKDLQKCEQSLNDFLDCSELLKKSTFKKGSPLKTYSRLRKAPAAATMGSIVSVNKANASNSQKNSKGNVPNSLPETLTTSKENDQDDCVVILNESIAPSNDAAHNYGNFSALRKVLKPNVKLIPKFEPYIPKSQHQNKKKSSTKTIPLSRFSALTTANGHSSKEERSSAKNDDIFEDFDSFLDDCDNFESDNVAAQISNLEKLLDLDPHKDDEDVDMNKGTNSTSPSVSPSKKSNIEVMLEKCLVEEEKQHSDALQAKGLPAANPSDSEHRYTKQKSKNTELIEKVLSKVSDPSILRAIKLLNVTKGFSMNIKPFPIAPTSKPVKPKRKYAARRPAAKPVARKLTATSAKFDKDFVNGMKITPYRPTLMETVGMKNGKMVLQPYSLSNGVHVISSHNNTPATAPTPSDKDISIVSEQPQPTNKIENPTSLQENVLKSSILSAGDNLVEMT